MRYFKILLLLSLFSLLDMLIDLYCQKIEVKRCKYNCENCKNWRCMKHYCDKKRRDY